MKITIKDKMAFITGVCLIIASFLPCWSIFGLTEAVIDEKGGLLVPIAAILAILASVPGIGIGQILAGIIPLGYLLVFRIQNRMFFSIVHASFGLFLIIVCCFVLIISGKMNLPKRKK